MARFRRSFARGQAPVARPMPATAKPDWGGGCYDRNVPQGYVFANGELICSVPFVPGTCRCWTTASQDSDSDSDYDYDQAKH